MVYQKYQWNFVFNLLQRIEHQCPSPVRAGILGQNQIKRRQPQALSELIGSDGKSDSLQLIQTTLDICDTAMDEEDPQGMLPALRSAQGVGMSNLCRFK